MPNHSLYFRVLPIAAAVAATGCASLLEDDIIDYTTDTVVYVEPQIEEPRLAAALPYIDDKTGGGGRALYAGAGIGFSRLTPDTSQAPGIDVDDEAAGAGQISVGMDINKQFAVELHSADLGSAGLSPVGRINYRLDGLSALYYAGKNRANKSRRGFTAFGRLGVAKAENSAIGDVAFEQNSVTQMLFGGGLEYNTRMGLGLRAEMISFDKDAQYAQLGLMYRLGQNDRYPEIPSGMQVSTQAPVQVIPAVSKPEPQLPPVLEQQVIEQPVVTAPLAPPVPEIEPRIADTDGDGVEDSRDRCQRTGQRVAVDKQGCALFNGRIEGVTFETASAELSDTGVDTLADIAYTLRKYPQAHMMVKAHTDNQGDPQRNQKLSELRARSVVDFLAQQGTPYDRMRAKAYGERSPIDTNDNAQGRANNRRVEIFAFDPAR